MNQPTLNIGDFLIRPKVLGFIDHFGVLIDYDKVLQNTPEKGEHVTSLKEFAAGQQITARPTGVNAWGVLLRARKILANPQKYNLLNRNCEDTAHEVVHGEAKSPFRSWVVISLFFALILWIFLRKK